MVDIDWKLWRYCSKKYSNEFLSIPMIGRLAALREFFKTNVDSYLSEFSLQESRREGLLRKSQTKTSAGSQGNENEESDNESDEFFDTLEYFLDDQVESNCAAEIYSQ
ncbi:hypothetical protein M8C21_019290, partial [Ambrosia artemisiifolia]